MNPNISLPQLPANLDPALRDYLFAWQKLITQKQLDDYTQSKKEEVALISNGIGINDSGINSNGIYIKFKDGTLICFTQKTWYGTINATTLQEVSTSINWTYPMAYISTPVILFSRRSGWVYFFESGYEQVTSSGVISWYIYNISGTAYTTNHDFDLLAIGRWRT